MRAFKSFTQRSRAPIRLLHSSAHILSLPTRVLTLPITISACSSKQECIWNYELLYARARITSPTMPASRQELRRNWHTTSMQNTTRPSSLRPQDRQWRGSERLRARARPITYLAKDAAHTASRNARTSVFIVEAMAVAVVAMAKTASNISKPIEVARMAPEHPGDPVHASPAESLAIRPKTAIRTLRMVPLPLRQNRSRQEKRRPSDAPSGSTGLGLA